MEDFSETATDKDREELIASLPQDVQKDLGKIVDDSMTSAMKDTLLATLVVVLLCFLASTFLPEEFERAVKPEDREMVEAEAG